MTFLCYSVRNVRMRNRLFFWEKPLEGRTMCKQEQFSDSMQTFRVCAESRLTPDGKRDIERMSTDDIARLLYELETHQDKLDIQNKGLRKAQAGRIQKALRASEERFRMLVESSSDWIWEVNNLGVYTYSSPQVENILGYKAAEVVGHTPFDFMPPDEAGQIADIFEDMARNNVAIAALDNVNIHKDGQSIILETNAAPFFDEDGNLSGYRGVDRDITKRKHRERNILQRKQYLRGLNDAAQVLLGAIDEVPFQEFVDKIGPVSGASRAYIFLNHHDPNGRLLMSLNAEWCADGICSRIDYPQLQGLPYEIASHWQTLLMRGVPISSPLSGFPDEVRVILEPFGIQSILLVPILMDSDFIGFIGFNNCVSDIEWDEVTQTFLCAAANDLSQAIKRVRSDERVKASLKEKETLLREIHHRVKNNMQIIISLLRIHARRSSSQSIKDVFRDCQERVNAMALIHEALYQSKDLARIDFAAYFRNLGRNLSLAHRKECCDVAFHVEECDVSLGMDKAIAVGNVVCELASNAFKYAFGNEKKGCITIRICDQGEGKRVLTIEDNGVGLPLHIDLERPETLGLKLVCATVSDQLDGSIEIDRKNGTKYTICFEDNERERENRR